MKITKLRIINSFNKGASTYDAAASVQAFIANRLADFLPMTAPQTILEVGCGTGIFSQHLIDQYPTSEILLTDIAPAMTEICHARYDHLDRVKIACMDGEQLTIPFSFDLIATSMTLHWFCDLQKSLKNLTAKLSPHGEIVFAMLTENSLCEWHAICSAYDLPVATPLFPSLQIIQQCCPEIELVIETYQHTYESLYDFLSSLKQLGAMAARAEYIPMSSGKLRSMMRLFENGITISYEVIYGRYKV